MRDVPVDFALAVNELGYAPLSEQEPVERRTVADEVVQRIINLVKSGNLRAGDRLPTENELATAFQISRPSVREGLKMLRILGVTESRQGGRYYVTDLSTSRLIKPIQFVVLLQEYNVATHLEARAAVDFALVRMACERATGEEIQQIQFLAEAGHKFVTDPVGFRLLDVEFHQKINDSARSPMLERISRSLYELGFEFRRIATEIPGVIENSVADHDLIARAIAARKADMAEKAFRQHLEHVRHTTTEAQAIVANRRRQQVGTPPSAAVRLATQKIPRKARKK
jgi:GntR family transcriptional repressor for pyruvate dehydrogenase complex